MIKRYIVTGATSGVGQAVAKAAELLAHVTYVGRDLKKLEITFKPADEFSSFRVIDFANASPFHVSMCIKALAEDHGPFDGVFHAAGEELISPLRTTGDDAYRRAMTFTDSGFAILRAAATKGVLVDGGSVVLMSSVAAHRGTAGMAAYSGARAAVEAMARCAAIELAPRRIRVNCVAAGAFDSALHQRVTGRMPEASREAYAKAHPLGFGHVEAVRDAVLHLLGPGSVWTTGTVHVVDGGFLAA